MNRLHKILVSGICIISFFIIGIRYFEYVVKNDFMIIVNAACDPTTQSCFKQDCSAVGTADCDETPYKKVHISAQEAPHCLQEHTCNDTVTCQGTSNQCLITFCSSTSLEDGETCIPIQDASGTNTAPSQI